MSTVIAHPGVSWEAGRIRRQYRDVVTRLHRAPSLGDEAVAFDELQAVWKECRHPGWDGHGAIPVTRATYRQALRLLKALPLGCPTPSFGAEADGELTLEWYNGPRQTLSVSVNGAGDVSYAALFGKQRAFGSEYFLGEFPERIFELIREVVAE